MGVNLAARSFVYLAIGSAIAAEIVVAGLGDLWPGPERFGVAIFLAILIALARRFPVHLAPKTKILVDTAPAFTAVLVLPPAAAALACAGGMVAGELAVHEPRLQAAFNIAQLALSALAAAGAYSFLSTRLGGPGDLAVLGGAAGAAVVMFLVNTALVDTVVALQLGANPFAGWWSNHRADIPHEGSLYLLGLLPALAVDRHPWVVALVALPAVLVHRALRDGIQLRIQTRRTVEALADIIDLRDRYTHQHSHRVAELSRRIGQEMGLGGDELERLFLAARVHDVGKIGIRGSILWKPDALSDDEWVEMRSHPEIGAELTSHLPEFRGGRELIRHHHERFDGSGYPDGLVGEDIPLGARIIAAADTFDAITSTRSYRIAADPEHALRELRRVAGTQLDPAVVEVLSRLKERETREGQHPAFEAPRVIPVTTP